MRIAGAWQHVGVAMNRAFLPIAAHIPCRASTCRHQNFAYVSLLFCARTAFTCLRDMPEWHLVERSVVLAHRPTEIDDPFAGRSSCDVHAVDPGPQNIGILAGRSD